MAAVPSFSSLHDLPAESGQTKDLHVLADRLRLVDRRVIYWYEVPTMTASQIDRTFDAFEALVEGLPAVGWVWDVGETEPPAPSVLLHLQRRISPLAPRVSHLALRTGANIGLWLSLRNVLPAAGFDAVSVHRNVNTALERATHG